MSYTDQDEIRELEEDVERLTRERDAALKRIKELEAEVKWLRVIGGRKIPRLNKPKPGK